MKQFLLWRVQIAVCWLFLSASAQALEWVPKDLHLKPKEGEQVLTGNFSFRNNGKKRIHLLSVTPGCDCTTAKLTRSFLAPGERGEIRVEYVIGDKQGRQETTIVVSTDEPEKRTETLILRIDLPEILVVEPRVVTWRVGDALGDKIVALRTSLAGGVKIDSLRVSDSRITANLDTSAADGSRRILIRTTETGQPMQAVVVLQASVGGKVRSEAIHVVVRP